MGPRSGYFDLCLRERSVLRMKQAGEIREKGTLVTAHLCGGGQTAARLEGHWPTTGGIISPSDCFAGDHYVVNTGGRASRWKKASGMPAPN